MSIIQEFKAFISKGNVMDLAVGVIIGAAFKSVVDALTKDLITPVIAPVIAGHDFSKFTLGPFLIGDFLNTVLSFLILAAVVFFLIVKPMNAFMARVGLAPVAPPPPEDTLLLREIRDSLKKQAGPQTP
ncbi:MAG: large conductance mechanosensitive channel protein MscL [Chthoniobacteraceae bacterium]|jgi:large conductance mechanosensitive channel